MNGSTATAKPRSKGGFTIGVGCPGCGGELELDEGFFVTNCSHCGSVLRIVMPDSPPAFLARAKVSDMHVRVHLDRYLKSKGMPLTSSAPQMKKIYYPYWKVDATLLKVRNRIEEKFSYTYGSEGEQVEHKEERPRTDVAMSPYTVTIAAGTPMPAMPESLGMRTEFIKLVPHSDDNIPDDYSALPVMRPWDAVYRRIYKSLDGLNEINPAAFGKNITRLFNPQFTLVYFPYIMLESYGDGYRRWLMDGITGRIVSDQDKRAVLLDDEDPPRQQRAATFSVVGSGSGASDASAFISDEDIADEPPSVTFGELGIDFHRCNNCGIDLPADKSYVYVCHNCQTLTLLDRTSLEIGEIMQAVSTGKETDVYVPFWWIRVPDDVASKVAYLFQSLDGFDKLIVPAVHSENFEALYRFTRRITTAHTRFDTEPLQQMENHHLPVQLRLSDALARAEMAICRAAVERNGDVKTDTELHAIEAGLVYVPFHLENYFYVDSVLNAITVERSALPL